MAGTTREPRTTSAAARRPATRRRRNAEPTSTVPPRAIYRRLLTIGMTPPEAGNIAAVAVGLDPVPGGWTVREIERVRFLRYLVGTERVGS